MYDFPPEKLYCPQWRKPMAKVCLRCPKWVQVHTVANPAGSWNCADAWAAILQVSAIQAANHNAAATESFRNEVIARKDAGDLIQAVEAHRRVLLDAPDNPNSIDDR